MSERSTSESASLACLLEAIAAKPGNVHRGADFDDMSFSDLAVSAVIIGQVFHRATDRSIGWLVRESMERIHRQVGRNTYLGTVLLLAPLSHSAWHWHDDQQVFETDIDTVLAQLTAADSDDVWSAIGLAQPAGMGSVPQMDLAGPAPPDLIAAMRMAQDRDLIAYQYANGFRTVRDEVLPLLSQGLRLGWSLGDAIVHAHVAIMARHPDSLIARKRGADIADQSRRMADQVFSAGPVGSHGYLRALGDLDFWLRSDGHHRNPGTTADLIAAGLFVLLRTGQVPEPIR